MAQAGRGPPAGGRLLVGARCYFKWSDGLWYPARVARVKEDDDGKRSVSILFDKRKSIIKGQARWYSVNDKKLRTTDPSEQGYMASFPRRVGHVEADWWEVERIVGEEDNPPGFLVRWKGSPSARLACPLSAPALQR